MRAGGVWAKVKIDIDMIKQVARVVAVEPGYLWVEAVAGAGDCAACRLGLGCSRATRRRLRLRCERTPPPEVDQWVELGLEEGAFLRGAALVYLLPLLGLGVGMLSAFALFGSQFGAAVGAGVGLAFGLGAARAAARRADAEPRLLGSAPAPDARNPAPCARSAPPRGVK